MMMVLVDVVESVQLKPYIQRKFQSYHSKIQESASGFGGKDREVACFLHEIDDVEAFESTVNGIGKQSMLTHVIYL